VTGIARCTRLDDVLTSPTLCGRFVQLEPLAVGHIPGVAAAAAEDRSSFTFSEVPNGLEEVTRYVSHNIDLARSGRQVPFAVRVLATDRIVGATRFMDLEVFGWPPPWPPGVTRGPAPSDDTPPSVAEIGGTWYAASAQRTVVNTECKLLLLSYAFDTWGVLRVTLKTDARNERSRTAILRIGARFEGIRRVHAPAVDGGVRDTAYYSIVAREWPEVHAHLKSLRDR
jgi:RimJ/RimL family protein N-acetyltransferase